MDKKVVFKVTRSDDLFDYAEDFSDIFEFSFNSKEALSKEPGVLREDPGFDFQRECKPTLRLTPLNTENNILGSGAVSDYCVNVFIEDVALKIRKKIDTIKFIDLYEPNEKTYDLKKLLDMSFTQGFIFSCSISRIDNTSKEELVWNKSQLVYHIEYEAKVNSEVSLFYITYREFDDELARKNVLFYIEWKSSDVSTIISDETFEVIANARLQDQLIRAERNKNFGVFLIQLIGMKIIEELVLSCLKYADLTSKPVENSLQDRVTGFLSSCKLDFTGYANQVQNNGLNALSAASEISVLIQKNVQLGESLESIKFGGMR